jgi:hypothetical protein
VRPTVIDDDECGICGSDQIWGRVLTPLDGFLWLCAECYDDSTEGSRT